jgi:hypothetical protein
MRVMHNMTSDLRPTASRDGDASAVYRERLSPSLWVLVAAAVSGPMVALVFVPLDSTVALVAGLLVGLAVIAGLVAASPAVIVDGTELRVGRAHVEVTLLGDPEGVTGEEARAARGPGLSRSAWHLFRPGIDALVRVPVNDPRDPIDEWVFSTRTPDRVVAVIRRAQAASRMSDPESA